MSEELVKVPAAPVGLSTRKLGIGVGAFAAIGVALGELVYGRVAAVILLGVGFLSLAVNGVRNRSETRRFNRDSPAMLARVARGEFAEAQDFFWRWSEQTRTPDVSAVARLNLGWILLLQGELHQASAVLGDSAERYSVELREQKLLYRTRIVAALADALRGDLEAASTGTETAMAASRVEQPLFALYVRAIVEIRQGRPGKAATALHDTWLTLEAGMSAKDLRPIRVIRAFAIAAGGVREAGSAHAALAGMRPAYPGEFAFLGAGWPEMKAFLASHELAG